MKTTSLALAAVSLFGLTVGQDRYQKVGNDVGQFYSSVGAVLADPSVDPASLSVAAQQADVAVASFKNEIRTMDWSELGPDAAKQQASNLEFYVNGLDNANAELHAIANKAAFEQANSNYNNARDFQYQQQKEPQQRYHVNNRINAVVTGVHNKAVVKEESSTITSSSEPTNSADSKESSRESKSSVKEEKSESRESKKEEKSASASSASAYKAAAASTRNHTTSSNHTRSNSSSATSSHHSKKNAAAISSGVSVAVLIGALFALL